jgi:hypothetical protein
LSRKVSRAELKVWLKDVPIDTAPFNAAQPIYTSAPVFVGRNDPLTVRLLRIPGAHRQVEVPDAETLQPPPATARKPVKPTSVLSPYAAAAIDNAARRIINAPRDQQEVTLNTECFSLGTLCGAGGAPAAFARRVLIWAAHQMPNHDPHHPWRAAEIEAKVNRAFDQGLRQPREIRHGAA